jgi:hypothetical protein
MEKELLQMCGYRDDATSLALVNEIKNNYLHFDEVVVALRDLQPFLQHSDYYLSLRSEQHMIKFKNDLLDQDDFLDLDAEIVVWANQHNIELQEDLGKILILGQRSSD